MSFFQGIGTFLSGGKNPANDAMKYLNQIPQIGRSSYQPYIDQGRRAGGIAEGQYSKMGQDPTAFINQLMAGYEPSKGYQYKQGQMLKGMGNSAAAGGFAGTQNDQNAQAETIQGMLGGDMQQWLANLLGVQGTGLQGLSGMNQMGYDASGSLADYLGSNLSQQGSLAFQGRQQKNANQQALFNSLLQAGASAAGAAAGMPSGGMGGGMSSANYGGYNGASTYSVPRGGDYSMGYGRR
jgi:hypothetical protein